MAFEIALDALPTPKAKAGKTKPRFEKADQTPVKRDFAFVVEEKRARGATSCGWRRRPIRS